MKAVFVAEAQEVSGLPAGRLDPRHACVTPRPNTTAGRTEFIYTGEKVGIPHGDSPFLLDKDYTITAEIEVPKGGAEGMMPPRAAGSAATASTCSRASRCGSGTSLDLERLKGDVGPDWSRARSRASTRRVRFQVRRPGRRHAGVQRLVAGLGRAGTGTAQGRPHTSSPPRRCRRPCLEVILQRDESFDIGSDTLDRRQRR